LIVIIIFKLKHGLCRLGIQGIDPFECLSITWIYFDCCACIERVVPKRTELLFHVNITMTIGI